MNEGTVAELRHDLRTPLNHIIGYGEMLMEDAAARGDEGLRQSMATILETARELVGVIQGVLAPSKSRATPEDLAALRDRLNGPVGAMRAQIGLLLENCDKSAQRDLETTRRAVDGLLTMVAGVAESAPSDSVALRPAEAQAGAGKRLLIVDDNSANRDVLSRRLAREGHTCVPAENGREALEILHAGGVELVLLDVMMPVMDGYEVLRAMKADPSLSHIPVLMISALDEVQSVARCIEMGAEDYLPKPFDPVLLRARVGACLEKKRLRDAELRKTEELERTLEQLKQTQEQLIVQERLASLGAQRSESLLLNILPAEVAEELRTKGMVAPKYFEDVTIIFTDFVGFTLSTETLAAEDLVGVLHDYFTAFDKICARYRLEKMKTIGDSYMCLGGLPVRNPAHPVDAVMAAFEMVEEVVRREREGGLVHWQVRVGIHTGPVIAGVVGINKFAFDIWGDTVNYSSRMESSGPPNRINLSERTYSRVKDFFDCEHRGKVLTKDTREYDMYLANGILPRLLDGAGQIPPAAFLRRYNVYFQKDPPSFPAFLAARP